MKYTAAQIKHQVNGFVFNANDFLKSILPSGWSDKRLVSIKNDIIKETNLMAETTANMVAMGLKSKRDVKVIIKDFVKRYGTGLANTEKSKKLPHGQNLLRNRVENDLLYENALNMEATHKGRHFIWLPSDAREPRHSHMLRYGKVFEVGNNELPENDNFPGKAFGCKCGYKWVEDPVTTYSTFDEENVDVYRHTRNKLLQDESTLEQLMLNVAIKVAEKLITPSAVSNAVKQLNKTYAGTSFLSSVRFWQAHNTVSERINLTKPVKTNAEKIARQDMLNAANFPKSARPLTVYRGTDLATIGFKIKPGMRIKLGRATFTSLDRTVAKQFTRGNKRQPVILKFELKTGAKILPSYPLSEYPEELEMLMAPLNTFEVVKILNATSAIPTIVLRSVVGKGKFKTLSL